jgi:two-component system response regulator HydG
MGDRRKVLIVDNEPNSIREISEMLSEDGYEVYESSDVEKVIDMIPGNDIAAIITDARMHCEDGMHLCEYVTGNHPDIPVILLTACSSDERAFPPRTPGVFCYFKKPADYLCLKGIVDRAVEQSLLKKEIKSLKKSLLDENIRYRIIGNTIEMRKIFEIIETIKDSESNVLVYGETGSGKELIARTINSCGKRDGPLITFNCAVMPKELVEFELFGWEKGSFPGTFSRRMGKFEEATNGTLFLDEIGDLELSLQSKLLRVLQEKEIQRLGSSQKIKVDFRLLSSTKRDLRKEVQNGNFREGLFYRISQIEITMPPLRERKDDIPLLVSAFTKEFGIREKKTLTIADKAMKIFENYSWPGNVRQLRNIVERAVIFATGDKITLRELPDELLSFKRITPTCNSMKTFKELEMEALKDVLEVCKGNKSKASKILGISRKAMYKRLREIRI